MISDLGKLGIFHEVTPTSHAILLPDGEIAGRNLQGR